MTPAALEGRFRWLDGHETVMEVSDPTADSVAIVQRDGNHLFWPTDELDDDGLLIFVEEVVKK